MILQQVLNVFDKFFASDLSLWISTLKKANWMAGTFAKYISTKVEVLDDVM